MAADPLVTISSHSVTHRDLIKLTDADIQMEAQQSKQLLESKLGIPIRYFTYPSGKYDARALQAMQETGYIAALTMNDADEQVAGQSKSLLEIARIGQSRIDEMVNVASRGRSVAWFEHGHNGSQCADSPHQRHDRRHALHVHRWGTTDDHPRQVAGAVAQDYRWNPRDRRRGWRLLLPGVSRFQRYARAGSQPD